MIGAAIILVAGLGVLCALPFFPIVREMSNSVVALIPGVSAFADTPIQPIIGLMPLFAIGVVLIAVGWAVLRSGG